MKSLEETTSVVNEGRSYSKLERNIILLKVNELVFLNDWKAVRVTSVSRGRSNHFNK